MTETATLAPATEDVTVTFPSYKLDAAIKKIDTLNRRLERSGVDARITYTTAQIEKKVARGGLLNEEIGTWIIEPTYVMEPHIVLTITSALELTVGDYTFVASLVAEEAGMTVHTAPGQSLAGWTRPAADDDHCDHCGTDRRRTRLYVVRNNVTGELVQVGHSCIELYLGAAPKGLFALEFAAEMKAFASEGGGSFSTADMGIEVNDVLATAFAYSDQGRSYVSTSRAFDGRPSTVSKVRDHIFHGAPRRGEFRGPQAEAEYQKALAEFVAKAEQIKAHLADTALIDAIKASVETVDAASDYGQNLRIILAGESGVVRARNVGILASLVAVYARENELAVKRAQEAKAPKVEGFLAPVTDAKGKASRVRDLEITLTKVKSFEGQFGWTTILSGVVPSGHQVEWFASGNLDYTVGDVLNLEAASVKAHKAAGSDQYTKADTTVLTRGKIKAEGGEA